MRRQRTCFTACFVLCVSALSFGSANIIINNVDAPGIGFNDPTPATPVGGNPGTTLGEQRLNVFQFAADLWGATLTSDVDIVVRATFQPLFCTPTSGTLGAAGPIQVFAFPDPAPPGVRPFTWYSVALANKIVGFDIVPGNTVAADDIIAFFNGAIGTDPNCLPGLSWYNGLDNQADVANELDLLNVVMHEMAHGLGFLELVDEGTGELLLGLPDIYSTFMYDNTLGTTWDSMSDAERLESQVNTLNVVWNGDAVNASAPDVLAPRTVLQIKFPRSIRGTFEAQPASFGPPIGSRSDHRFHWWYRRFNFVFGRVVPADDGVGVGSDACEPLVNNVYRRIALVDRGSCNFTTKVKNAQDAGAKAVIVVNNVPKGFPSMGGSDPEIVIPSVGVSMETGEILASKRFVFTKIREDKRQLAGTDGSGRVRLYTPDPVAPGSSKSHWDVTARPNLLMEPFINSDLATADELDLTPLLLEDIGWELDPTLTTTSSTFTDDDSDR